MKDFRELYNGTVSHSFLNLVDFNKRNTFENHLSKFN